MNLHELCVAINCYLIKHQTHKMKCPIDIKIVKQLAKVSTTKKVSNMWCLPSPGCYPLGHTVLVIWYLPKSSISEFLHKEEF